MVNAKDTSSKKSILHIQWNYKISIEVHSQVIWNSGFVINCIKFVFVSASWNKLISFRQIDKYTKYTSIIYMFDTQPLPLRRVGRTSQKLADIGRTLFCLESRECQKGRGSSCSRNGRREVELAMLNRRFYFNVNHSLLYKI